MVRSMATQLLQENERRNAGRSGVPGVKPLALEGIVLAVGFAVASLMLLVPREHGER
jgi:hypothetical protein